MRSLSVLIPNRYSWDGICLTIESILKRTRYPNYQVIVCDNSLAPNNRACEPHEVKILDGDDGNRREYLRHQAQLGNIQLIENVDQPERYGHGENIKLLLKACKTDLAMLFVSSTEILFSDWLTVLTDSVRSRRDLGVARMLSGGIHFEKMFKPPVYWPNVMLLDMTKYRDFERDGDWDLEYIPYSQFKRKELFKDFFLPDDPMVFCDTGWRLWERLEYDNPSRYRMRPLISDYYTKKIKIIGGLDRNSHRPHIPYVQEKFAEIERRLKVLRGQ